MKREMLLAVTILFIACSNDKAAAVDADDGVTDTATEQTPLDGDGADDEGVSDDALGGEDADALVPVDLGEALSAAGFTVQHGRFEFYDLELCCAPGGFCSGTNPSSPYGRVMVPTAPGQTVPNPNADDQGVSAAFRLRADEAVVLAGVTPPQARYLGFTSYLMDRNRPEGGRVTLFASLGDSLNHRILKTADGASAPFDSAFALILTADRRTEERVRGAFNAAGVDPNSVNTDVIPSEVFRFGLDAAADTYGHFLRIAVPASDDALEAYIAAPPLSVYRLTPNEELPLDALPAEPLRSKGSGTSESALIGAVEALADSLRAKLALEYPGAEIVEVPTLAAPKTFTGSMCIAALKPCYGDNADALYMGSGTTGTFLLDDNDVVVVYGVNHHATGKASYANAALSNVEKAMGVVAIDDTHMAGSALPYIEPSAEADLLYVYKMARSCGAKPYCVEVPSEGCPFLPLDGEANLVFRAYVEPDTATGPVEEEVIVDRALRVVMP